MSYVWYFEPNYKAPYWNANIEESCELAYDYFSLLLDDFIAKLPEYRQPLPFDDWLAEDPTLGDRVHLIFPNGFGKMDSERNHNPDVWPWLIALSDCLHDDDIMVQEYAKNASQYWSRRLEHEKPTMEQSLHAAFDFFTAYIQLFVTLINPDFLDLDFKFPPFDENGHFIKSS